MFEAEQTFLFEDALRWVTLDRLKLTPYYKILNDKIPSQNLGGRLGLKLKFNLEQNYQDLFYDVYSANPKEDAIELVHSVSLENRASLQTVDDEYFISIGKYPLVKISYGLVNTQSFLTYLYLQRLQNEDEELNLLENKLFKSLPKGQPIFKIKDMKRYITGKDCVLIKHTNLIFTQDETLADTIKDEFKAVIKKYSYKTVLQIDKIYINIFTTATKRLFPVIKEDDLLVATPLSSLYHLSLDFSNPKAFDYICFYRDQKEPDKKIIYGNPNYQAFVKYYIP